MLSNFGAAKFDSARSGCATVARDVHRFCLSLLRTALPQACTLCTAASGEALLCADCRSEMPRNDPACPRCALPLAAAQTCGACLATPPPFAMTIAPWRYAFPADRLLHAFKYGGHLALADAFAAALAQAIAERCAPLPDRVVPIPLSDARQRMRGFNHAQEIARGVALHTGVPLCAGLRRVRDAPPQAGLARAARLRNVRGAFLLRPTPRRAGDRDRRRRDDHRRDARGPLRSPRFTRAPRASTRGSSRARCAAHASG